EAMTEPAAPPPPPAPARRALPELRSIPPLAVVGVAVAVGLVVWLIVHFTGGKSTKPAARAPATAVSLSGLRTLAGAVASPIYWIGPQAGHTYELTKTADNRIYIRYLPKGVPVGTSQAYLTVGTYPVANA